MAWSLSNKNRVPVPTFIAMHSVRRLHTAFSFTSQANVIDKICNYQKQHGISKKDDQAFMYNVVNFPWRFSAVR